MTATAAGAVVRAEDPVSRAGLVSHLEAAGIPVLPDQEWHRADVAVLVVERFIGEVVAGLRREVGRTGTPVVLVADELSTEEFLIAVDCGITAVVPRTAAGGDLVVRAVRAAAVGDGLLPPRLVGEALRRLQTARREAQPRGASSPNAQLSKREVEVLRLMADGLDTAEVAERLSCSQRTVKNVVYGITVRLNLRNRSHAVAYAVRCGLI
ncbi:helix-turn-helix transcriptional regulator [Saccharothrix syringae]|uniref:Response regulator transcription factor n=1 Tax=Saccharothrix syringae TaxID=103733 RepID=A0A5Q0GW46_SACSY|nr:LuxR C-terminal-related transcriptional regulator [Saccharothrix syringae]QFZ17875.1 response regulator transcription factor [Saccharothrix syringae]